MVKTSKESRFTYLACDEVRTKSTKVAKQFSIIEIGDCFVPRVHRRVSLAVDNKEVSLKANAFGVKK